MQLTKNWWWKQQFYNPNEIWILIVISNWTNTDYNANLVNKIPKKRSDIFSSCFNAMTFFKQNFCYLRLFYWYIDDLQRHLFCFVTANQFGSRHWRSYCCYCNAIYQHHNWKMSFNSGPTSYRYTMGPKEERIGLSRSPASQ